MSLDGGLVEHKEEIASFVQTSQLVVERPIDVQQGMKTMMNQRALQSPWRGQLSVQLAVGASRTA